MNCLVGSKGGGASASAAELEPAPAPALMVPPPGKGVVGVAGSALAPGAAQGGTRHETSCVCVFQ